MIPINAKTVNVPEFLHLFSANKKIARTMVKMKKIRNLQRKYNKKTKIKKMNLDQRTNKMQVKDRKENIEKFRA